MEASTKTMSENSNENPNPNFRLKSVAEFLDGNHHFFIPSYQRGYRWDKKQVEDLLKDIWDFAKNPKCEGGEFYCLQPIVVKEKSWKKEGEQCNGWEVIDGQQRLTTLWLILEYIKKDSRNPFVTKSILYDLKYETRKQLDLSNPNMSQNIDEFYVFQAKEIIKNWFENQPAENEINYSAFETVLFNKNKAVDKVKFIWYVIENEDNLNSIRVFNNLNRGKIRLTNAELIKALFVLNAKNENYPVTELMLEWDMIENALHDDAFWLFLTNKDYNPATRIDLIFDFLTKKGDKKNAEDDTDFSYRKFQNLYDGVTEKCWIDLKVNSFKDAWKKVKSTYQMFLFWYENGLLYHYIGYLLAIGVPHKEIFDKVNDKLKNIMIKEIKQLIKEKIDVSAEKIKELSYSDDKNKDKVRKILLLFNIESCTKSYAYRFPFNLYKEENWDIEHIAPQTDNNLQKTSDKISWLNFAETIICNDPKWEELKKQSLELSEKLEKTKKDEGDNFKNLYEEVIQIVEPTDEYSIENKDLIGNLTLLDAGTNRSYGNALFQTKRMIILDKDKNGFFIPPCTKNIFLKYYTSEDNKNSQWKNSWMANDAKSYEEEIITVINDFLNK
jgi:hypothetical protein